MSDENQNIDVEDVSGSETPQRVKPLSVWVCTIGCGVPIVAMAVIAVGWIISYFVFPESPGMLDFIPDYLLEQVILAVFGWIPLVGILSGFWGYWKIRSLPGVYRGKRQIKNMFVSLVGFYLLMAFVLPMIARPRSGVRVSCANNLKQLGLIFKIYANESPGNFYPDINMDFGMLLADGHQVLPDRHQVYPEYMRDPRMFLCPSDPKSDRSKNTIDLVYPNNN